MAGRAARHVPGSTAGAVWLAALLALAVWTGTARADWLSDFEADAAAWMAEEGVPGMSVVIVKDDAVIYARGFGHVSGTPGAAAVDADTVFLLGSTSKAFGVAQIALLADQEKLAWDEVAASRLPEFRMYDPWVNARFQVEDLLCHRSGLPMYALTMMEMLDYPTDSRVRGLRYVPPATSFRTTFAYQNAMFITASRFIEAVTGQGWEEHLTTALFTPLSMTRSVASQAAVDRMQNVAVGHIPLDDGSLWPVPSDWFWNQTQDRAMAAAAVRTTAGDMGKWLRFNLSLGRIGATRVVSEAGMRRAQAPKVLISPYDHGQDSPYWGPVSYALGWMHFGVSPQPFLYHDGGAMGSGSAIGFAPGGNVGIAIMTNLLGGDGLASRLVWRFYDLYFTAQAGAEAARFLEKRRAAASGGAGAEVAGKRASPARPLADYCGGYAHPAYGVFTVEQGASGLEAVMGPNRYRATLVPDGGDAFTAYLPGYPEGFSMTVPVKFEFPASGPALMKTGPILHDPQETFTRVGVEAAAGLLLLGDE